MTKLGLRRSPRRLAAIVVALCALPSCDEAVVGEELDAGTSITADSGTPAAAAQCAQMAESTCQAAAACATTSLFYMSYADGVLTVEFTSMAQCLAWERASCTSDQRTEADLQACQAALPAALCVEVRHDGADVQALEIPAECVSAR